MASYWLIPSVTIFISYKVLFSNTRDQDFNICLFIKRFYFTIQTYIRRSLYVGTSETKYPQIGLPSFPWTLLLFPPLGAHLFGSMNSRIRSDLPGTDLATCSHLQVHPCSHQWHVYSSLCFSFVCSCVDAPACFHMLTVVAVWQSLLIYKCFCFCQRPHSAFST